MNTHKNNHCPLCFTNNSTPFYRDRLRIYLKCPNCFLVYVPSQYHLDQEDEKKRYDLHQNKSYDLKYRQFLSKLLTVMVPQLQRGSRGLDFGSGPGPTLSLMFTELGFSMQIYDPFYANDKTVLNDTYDFISCSETFEHFRKPQEEWELLLRLVKRKGWIGIMTQLFQKEMVFSNWYYKNDETHICFYSKETFTWLANRYELDFHFYGSSVILFQT